MNGGLTEFVGDHAEKYSNLVIATVPTGAGNTDGYIHAPVTGKLIAAIASFIDALAAHDTNYVSFLLTNLGLDGTGTNAMLAASNANTSRITGGAAIVANARRILTLHGTPANLEVTQFSRLRYRVTGSGTLANTLTGGALHLVFEQKV